MKHTKMILFLGALTVGQAVLSQEVLPEVTVKAVRYKYLSSVDNKELPQPVRMLERKAAEYDVKASEFYNDEYDEYYISFILPAGYVLATYDKDGKLLRTAERFKNVAVPKTVARAVAERYPQWGISNDVYLVNYLEDSGSRKVWKLLLQNGDRRMRVKLNEMGTFLD